MTLVVEGYIASGTNAGVNTNDDGSFIHVTETGLVTSDTFVAIWINSDEVQVVNDGKVQGDYGIWSNNAATSIVNSGKVIGELFGVHFSNPDNALVNHGSVKSGANGTGVDMQGADGNLLNYGKIVGGLFGVEMVAVGGDLSNFGTISAKNSTDAVVGDSNVQDIYNKGTIDGNVTLFAGNDSYDGRSAGIVTGSVFGGDGNDELRGGSKTDRLFGENNNDTLSGRNGNDKLDGGAGFDIIAGGKGNDKLWGGTSADDFVFSGNAGDDVIKDWEDGSDDLDLSAYGITNTTKFISKAVSSSGGDAYVDLSFAGRDGVIKIADAGGDIDFFDFIFFIV